MILIHCSSLADIVTEPKLKVDKEAGNLSETAKSEVLRIWIANSYGKTKEYSTKYTEKGNTCEEAAITMFSRWSGIPCFKNEQFYKNKYLIGTPDILEDDVLADVKSNWDLLTFYKTKQEDYEPQVQGYMDVTGIHTAYRCDCLINCPEPILQQEVYRQQQKNPLDDPAKVEKRVRENLTFDNVPFAKRMKVFEFTYDPAFIEKAYKKIEAARKYYDGLVLEDVKPFNLVTA